MDDRAEIVDRIYSMFIEGKTPFTIAKTLTEEGVQTPCDKNNWGSAVAESILSNEKYKGYEDRYNGIEKKVEELQAQSEQ